MSADKTVMYKVLLNPLLVIFAIFLSLCRCPTNHVRTCYCIMVSDITVDHRD